MSNILIVFFSRTNTTKKVAEALAQKLGTDLEEIKSVKSFSGPIGYLRAGREAMKKMAAEIKPAIKNPADYDLVILGTPIWGWIVSSPVRAYLEQNKDKIKNVAFFCTMSGSGDLQAFEEMADVAKQKPKAVLGLLTKEVVTNQAEEKINEFINKINS